MAFTPDAKRLVSISVDGSLRVWPLEGGAGDRHRILHQAEGNFAFPGDLAMAPDGSFVVSGNRKPFVLTWREAPRLGHADHQLL